LQFSWHYGLLIAGEFKKFQNSSILNSLFVSHKEVKKTYD
jgi:hypothetical protein